MKLFRSSACFFALAFIICINGVFSKFESEDSYTKHCSSVIPPYNITTHSYRDSLPSLSTSYFTGGDRFQRTQPQWTYNYEPTNLSLRLRPDHYQTTAASVYNVEGFLYIAFAYRPDDSPGYPARESLRFPMNGFWSEKSRKLCMVGSTSWKGTDLDAVLKLKFDDENPTIHTGVVSGSLESTAASANDPAYFDPILIFDFPPSPNYNYSLVSEEIGGVFPSRKDDESSLSLDSTVFCSVMKQGLMSLEMEYATECAERRRRNRCSPIGFLPNYLSLTSIQCEKESKRARFLATFRNYSSSGYDNFPPNSTAIGEAWWDYKSNRINAVACGILNPSLQLGNAVGDCTMRLSLNHPSVLTLRNDANIEGEIWSSKSEEDSGYFKRINLTISADDYAAVALRPDQRYKYTELDRARESCSFQNKTDVKKKGNEYPDAQSDDMRFDMNVKNGDGRSLASAYATPVWVEHDSFETVTDAVYVEFAALRPPVMKLDPAQKRDITWPTRMSYRITISPHDHDFESSSSVSTPPSLDWPVLNPLGVAVITAEGLYDAETGHLCMVGCRKLARNPIATFKDCEIVVELDLPMLNGERGRLVKGILRSTRPQTDPLHFDDLVMDSAAYNQGEAGRSIRRMDFEIGMVLVSNALVCIFVALQIFHVRKNHEVASSVSLVMLVILCAGHMIPLVLNIEEAGNGGRLEANEVAVRVITMVTLLLQLRLLQLVYADSKQRENLWSGEKRACFVSISFYVLGGLLTLALRKTYDDGRYSVWGDLRPYGGMILDGFLLPQILLNIFRGSDSGEKALCGSFYVGTSAVRLVPHVYNQYRSHNYPKYDLDTTYYYANAAADLYSTACDIIFPCGIIALSVIVFVQQRKGGCCILPQRFRGFEKVPTVGNR